MQYLRNKFRKFARRVGVPDSVRMYDLRHTSATLLLLDGESLRVIADRLGHEDPAVTLKHYIRFLPAAQQSARDRIGRLFGPKTADERQTAEKSA